MDVLGYKRALEQSQKEKERMITERKNLAKRIPEPTSSVL